MLGDALVTVATAADNVLKLPDQLFGSTIVIALPAGVYTITATAPASPYGVTTNATATASVSLLSGNAATALSLAYALSQTVSIVVTAPTTAVLGNGGVATFAYAVTDTGNAPVHLHFSGSPSTFNFTFSPVNASLGPTGANRSIGGEVTIRVPSGTPVSYPTIAIEALLPNGQPAGFAAPEPKISLTPTYSLTLGASPSSEAVVSPFEATVPFYLRNTGTATASVELSVADASRLTGLGWTTEILSGQSSVNAPVSIGAAGNSSYTLKLTSPSQQAIPPGTVTVAAMLLNGSRASTTLVLTVPPLSVGVNESTIVVTGPSLTSAPTLPTFVIPILVFVPTAALLVVLGVQRYLATRRWSRK